MKSSQNYKQTLCWACKNACGKCSWSAQFKPINGWNATPTKLYYNSCNGDETTSFLVHECPEFVHDGRSAKKSVVFAMDTCHDDNNATKKCVLSADKDYVLTKRNKNIIRMRLAGVTYKTISQKHGITIRSVKQICNSYTDMYLWQRKIGGISG